MTLHATQLVKRFGKNTVLDGVDFAPEAGQVTVLLGRNGTGKSTFMKLALGVLKPNGGALTVCGLDPQRRARDIRRAVGYVPDKPDAYLWMTPRDLYRFLAPQYPTWNKDTLERLSEALEVPMRTKFRALSRGEGMKAMLAAAMAHEPELLLLDEPFAGLDPIVREEVLRGVIGELKGKTVLCTTHDLDVASRIADAIAILENGKIEMRKAGAPHQLKELLAC